MGLVAPTASEAAFERGERGLEYLPEASWDVVKAVDPSMGTLTGATEKSITFYTQAKDPVPSWRKQKSWGDVFGEMLTSSIPVYGGMKLGSDYGQQGIEDLWYLYRHWDRPWDALMRRQAPCPKR